MKENYKKWLVVAGSLIFSSQLFAGIALSISPTGASIQFPSKDHGGGMLSLDTSQPSGADLLTILGGVTQEIPARTAIGEVFKWNGDSATLSSIDFVAAGSGGKGVYQVFLLDLGSDTFSNASHFFDPANHDNLFNAGDTLTITNSEEKEFIEVGFSVTDRITLQDGDSYAFGLLSTNSVSDLTLVRSGGGPSDPLGAGFTTDGLDSTSANVSPFSSSGVRNIFLGVYTIPPPPPAVSMTATHLATIGTHLGILPGPLVGRAYSRAVHSLPATQWGESQKEGIL